MQTDRIGYFVVRCLSGDDDAVAPGHPGSGSHRTLIHSSTALAAISCPKGSIEKSVNASCVHFIFVFLVVVVVIVIHSMSYI